MDQAVLARSLPRIPDFNSMPKGLAAYRLSQEGRQETADFRQKFLVVNSKHQHAHYGGNASLQEEKNNLSRELPSSAPPGFRVKDGSRRNHVIMCATNRKRMSKTTFEEKARQRMKNYIAKQIYKIPTCQRPEFFKKVHVDPRPPQPYPKGKLSTTNCHFNYVSPKKFLDDNYKELLGKSTTKNNELNALKSSSLERKRNKIIENILSANNQDIFDKETNNTHVHRTSMSDTSSACSLRHPSSSKPASARSNGNLNSNKSLGENEIGDKPSSSSISRSKTVAFCVPDKIYETNYRIGISSNENHVDNSKDILVHKYHSTNSQRDRKGLTPADIASAHARYHFIHPEWPSELVNWARYSHPSTSEQFRHSFI